ncbi:MAG: hypothetical protein H7Z16_12640 [Pyrinomonadaceae bacterium]|nr:hypothetical protein [Pyrinomonadaceae bacterium]
MIVDLIDKLLDRCIQFVERGEKIQRELYSDFLAPALEVFEKVHRNYIDTFVSYRRTLESSRELMDEHHSIFNTIADDSSLTGDMRSKIVALRSFEDNPIFGRFVRRMCGYIVGQAMAAEVLVKGYHPPNASRDSLYTGLEQIFKSSIPEDDKRSQAIKVTNGLLNEIQDHYQLVMDEHVRVKARLLGLKVPEEGMSDPDKRDLYYEKRFPKRRKRAVVK